VAAQCFACQHRPLQGPFCTLLFFSMVERGFSILDLSTPFREATPPGSTVLAAGLQIAKQASVAIQRD